jgi:hypothetical protein
VVTISSGLGRVAGLQGRWLNCVFHLMVNGDKLNQMKTTLNHIKTNSGIKLKQLYI